MAAPYNKRMFTVISNKSCSKSYIRLYTSHIFQKNALNGQIGPLQSQNRRTPAVLSSCRSISFTTRHARRPHCQISQVPLQVGTKNHYCCDHGHTMKQEFLRCTPHTYIRCHTYCSHGDDSESPRPGRNKIQLMDFPRIIARPQMFYPILACRNAFFTLLIRGYFDDTFSQQGFLEGAELALSVVSERISEGNFDDLEGIVHSSAVPEIRQNYMRLNDEERRWLRVDTRDIWGRSIYQIGVIMPDDDSDKRFVEITTVFMGCHGSAEQPIAQAYHGHMLDHLGDMYTCNYRFIREYTKGVEDSWVINKLNHFGWG